ncbi:adenylate/guanylate cyclase domain-containing protein [Spirochaetia bacterium]|nr:adenylate/guanylate cyclase domain-containing protein [Spirochaetia bacterium]
MLEKLRFPIGAKLILIVTILLLVSLGLITSLVAMFVSSDILKTAKKNNFEINEMSAQTTENELLSIKANTSVLLNNLSVLYSQKNNNTEVQHWNYFFSANSDIAGIVLRTENESRQNTSGSVFINEQFLTANNLAGTMFDNFIINYKGMLDRSLLGDTLVFNATPYFNDTAILAMSFTLQPFSSAVVFFSSLSITEAFGTGANSTTVINTSGDILISSDIEKITKGANVSDDIFVRYTLKSEDNILDEHYKDESGNSFIGNAHKLEDSNVVVFTTIGENIFFEGIQATTRRNIYLSLLVWFLSILFIWFFSKTISNPLVELQDAAASIEIGEYHLNLKNNNMDETGVLTQAVSGMSNVLANFEKFTNKVIARLARLGTLETGGASKQATIFFSDIRSFTAISEKLTPEEVVEFLNQYMERMVACVILTGGAIDKFIGDAVMAHWGAVETSGSAEKDALNGVRASLMMRASLYSFNKGRGTSEKDPIIKIGCGLNTGTVVAGQIGSQERVVFTVIGDTVSFADRTETFNKVFGTQILITENTYKLVWKYLTAKEMGEVTEDGKKVKIYAVINMKDEEQLTLMMADLEKVPGIDMALSRLCVGPQGPKTIEELRTLLDIEAPDLKDTNLDEEEKKYSVGNEEK